MSLASDNFQRANENPLSDGGNWTSGPWGYNAPRVVSDAATYQSAGSPESIAIWTGATPPSWTVNQYAEVAFGENADFWDFTGASIRSVIARSNSGYCAAADNGGKALLVGFGSQLAFVAGAPRSGDVLRCQGIGATISGLLNGVSWASVTDSTYSTGNPGLVVENIQGNPSTLTLWSADEPAVEPANPPTFGPVAGSYAGIQSVSISTTSAGASIYYTTDGSTPTTSSPLYTGLITVSTSLTIKAIASGDGFSDSSVASAAYTITAPPAPTSPEITLKNGIPQPIQLFGRLPNGTIAGIAVDSNGNLAVSGGGGGSLNVVDVLLNGRAAIAAIVGRLPNGKLATVTVDESGNLCTAIGGGGFVNTQDVGSSSPRAVQLFGRAPSGKLIAVGLNAANSLGNSIDGGSTANVVDVATNITPQPVILCGRTPSGRIVAVALTAAGELCITGAGGSSTNSVDTYGNSTYKRIQIFGRNASTGVLQSVSLDANGNLELA